MERFNRSTIKKPISVSGHRDVGSAPIEQTLKISWSGRGHSLHTFPLFTHFLSYRDPERDRAKVLLTMRGLESILTMN